METTASPTRSLAARDLFERFLALPTPDRANDYNDENLFVIGSAYDEIKEPGRTKIKVDAARCSKLGSYMREEMKRIFSLSEKFTPGE